MKPNTDLEEIIDERIGEVRTEALDISFGELVNLHKNRELIIAPEYQRLFRWTEEQESRLVESIMLELPIPQIFVVENSNGVFELIDGLQRVSSIVHFIEPEALEKAALTLIGCDLVPELNGVSFHVLPLALRLRLKRSAVRVIVIKKQSAGRLRFEMFKRLNTGGSLLAPQEIRNVTARILGESGIRFYGMLQTLAADPNFVKCTSTLAEKDKEQKADEELVLRFFAAKNARDQFKGSVREWLDQYMEDVILDRRTFDAGAEEDSFRRVFAALGDKIGDGAFVRYRGKWPTGGLAPAYYEAVTIGALHAMEALNSADADAVKNAVATAVQSASFRDLTGPGANSRGKLEGRIELLTKALTQLGRE